MNHEETKHQTVFKNTEDPVQGKKTDSGMDENLLGLLAYLFGIITGVILLFIEKENKFVRFHAFQSIFTFVSVLVLSFALTFIPFIGWVISLLLSPVIFVLWVVLMYKAYKGEKFKLPIVGDLAEKQAEGM